MKVRRSQQSPITQAGVITARHAGNCSCAKESVKPLSYRTVLRLVINILAFLEADYNNNMTIYLSHE